MLKELQYLCSGKEFGPDGDKKREEIIDKLRSSSFLSENYSYEIGLEENVINALQSFSTLLAFALDGHQKIQLTVAKLEGRLEAALENKEAPQEELMKLAALINYNRGVLDAFGGLKEIHQACMDGKLGEFMEDLRKVKEGQQSVSQDQTQDRNFDKFFVGGSKLVN